MSPHPSPPDSGSPRFALLVPVKRLSRAKTRLAGSPVGPGELMRAFAGDALAAAAACPAVAAVYAVTDETALVLPDRVGTLPDLGDGDLNAALRHAERGVRLQHPGLGVAAMCGDLPCLRAEDLGLALTSSTAPRWYAADAGGRGTTLLAARPGVDLDPHFGPDSAQRHEQSGARPLRAAVSTLRRDVDTATDLVEAVALGVGRLTRATLDATPRG